MEVYLRLCKKHSSSSWIFMQFKLLVLWWQHNIHKPCSICCLINCLILIARTFNKDLHCNFFYCYWNLGTKISVLKCLYWNKYMEIPLIFEFFIIFSLLQRRFPLEKLAWRGVYLILFCVMIFCLCYETK